MTDPVEMFADVLTRFIERKRKATRGFTMCEGRHAWYALSEVDEVTADRIIGTANDPWDKDSATGFWSWLAGEYGVIS